MVENRGSERILATKTNIRIRHSPSNLWDRNADPSQDERKISGGLVGKRSCARTNVEYLTSTTCVALEDISSTDLELGEYQEFSYFCRGGICASYPHISSGVYSSWCKSLRSGVRWEDRT